MITPPPGIVVPTVFGAPAGEPATAHTAVPPDAVDDATRAAPPRRSRARWRLVLPDGTEHPLTGSVVVGRQPSATLVAGVTETLTVTDAEGLISKSHAVFELVDGEVFVRDLGSTNGVVVIAPDDTETVVSSAGRTRVDDGDEIELGSFAIAVVRGQ